ncbi:hypothetical protein KXV31_004899 [Aspergillus fumigatus]|nr:hypothetical protein CNMCM8686_002580 [Aspergillus fumigatus]KAH1886438.1 hypothetical protein KXX01_009204 [Aspergillus fumigatus]KAH2015876.1 hypothetical protein KXV45_005220 [Aspergillus fumigatus]KAH2882656.1 hypothetical protein KXV31_004899 [Aspergillus fumigatus]KAH3065388.1 hypothetical protein KXW16_006797 [Aspergillus fumigatus]
MKEASNNLPKPFATYLPVAHKPAGRIIESVSTVVFFQYRIGCLAIDDGTNLSATHADDAFKNDILNTVASKIVLITGANTGIGFQVVRALCNSTQTYSIIVGGRSPAKVHSAIRAIQSEFTNCQSQLYPLQIDLESDDSIKHASEDISTKFGRLDALVNNAGAWFDAQANATMTERQMWAKTWDVNVTGTHLLTSALMPLLLKSPDPRLLFVTSGAARLAGTDDLRLPINRSPPAGWPKPAGITATAYRSAKTGLSMVLREWGRILKNDGVKIWGIAPGYLATGLGGGTAEEMKKNGAEDADVAGPFIRIKISKDNAAHSLHSNLVEEAKKLRTPFDRQALLGNCTRTEPDEGRQKKLEDEIGTTIKVAAERQERTAENPHLLPETVKVTGVHASAAAATGPPYCILSERKKIFVILLVSFAAIISPISSSIYFPALNSLAKDLNVSVSLINITITTYLIFQGIAPSFIANFADTHGRRPAYLICFTIYLAANIGLAVQDSYASLLVLRCLQSSGSSGTIALGSAVVADLSTRAERGKYIGYASLGVTLGPALGPIIGGLLDHYLGWRAVFWFLVILSSVLGTVIAIILPETCRAVVGNGSVPAAKWNRPAWQILRQNRRAQRQTPTPDYHTIEKRRRRANPIASALIATDKEALIILIYSSLLFSGYMAVLSTLTSQLQSRFHFNSIQVGLCYLPIGIGSLSSRWTVGRILDWNFRREARRQGLAIEKNRQQDIRHFNIEAARLAVTIPLVYCACLCIVAYGWVMEYKTALAGPVVMLFFMGHLTSGAFSSLSTLIVDLNRQSPATAVAANNLFRCLLGAGVVAAADPVIQHIGIGWTATLIAFLWVLLSPLMWAVSRWGHGWREKRISNEKEASPAEELSRPVGEVPTAKEGV